MKWIEKLQNQVQTLNFKLLTISIGGVTKSMHFQTYYQVKMLIGKDNLGRKA